MGSNRKAVLLLMSLAVLVAGCGDSSSGSEAQRPERIVSLSPTATETLFAVGAGDQVVAVDDQSDYPRAAPQTDLSSFQPNVEAVARYEPDLVVASDGLPGDAVEGMRRLGLRVLIQPAAQDLADAYAQIRQLGRVTGRTEAGERVADDVRTEVERAIASAPDGARLRVFHELDPELFTAGSDSFIGRIYGRLGLTNVADPAARKAGNPYPQMSSEAVVAADPSLIVLADTECCGQTPAKVAARAGWAGVAAVENDGVVGVDDDIASRWGPRIPIFVRQVVRAIERLRADGGGG